MVVVVESAKIGKMLVVQRARSLGLLQRRGDESWMAVGHRLDVLSAQYDPMNYPQNYVLIVEAHGGRCKPGYGDEIDQNPAFQQKLFCRAYEGESVEQFFRSGTISVLLDTPLRWNDPNNNVVYNNASGYDLHIGRFALKSRISLLRKGDGKVIELDAFKQCGYFYLPTGVRNAHISSGTISNQSAVNEPDLFRLCFEEELAEHFDDEEEGYSELELEFSLIHENEDYASVTDLSFPVIGFFTSLRKNIGTSGDTMEEDDWPFGIKFAHFIEMSDAWKNNFTRMSEWRSLAGETIPDSERRL